MPKRHRFRLIPSVSTVLIIIGVVLMAIGLATAYQYRPRPLTAAEQAALQEGERLSHEGDSAAAPALLPAPGTEHMAERGDIVSLDDGQTASPSQAVAPGDSSGAEAASPTALPSDPTTSTAGETTPAETTAGDTTALVAPQSAPAAAQPSVPTAPQPVLNAPLPAQSSPTRFVAPTIGVDSKVEDVGFKTVKQGNQWFSEWETADYAVGFHKISALPGHVGNTVLSGHNNIKGEVFRNLIDLNIGDPISLWADGREYRYVVTDKFIVQEVGASMDQRIANARWIATTDDERLTMVSCWPYWTNTHRAIVIARPVSSVNGVQARAASFAAAASNPDSCILKPSTYLVADAWANTEDLRRRLGCPTSMPNSIQVTQQPFKGGRMIWRPDTASISVLYDDGHWQNVLSVTGLQPEAPPEGTQACTQEPKLGFGKVWSSMSAVRGRLGCPAGDEQGLGASVQNFNGGTALSFGDSTAPVLLLRDGTWQSIRP
ncbi:MAG: sortase [Anaerolineae bacterium]